MKNEESRMPGISIIIPVYNSEKYLRACLDSALAQTLEDIEILCVDDGSKDGSADIIRDYQKRTDRIVLLQQENRGAAAARNRGLERAEGEYIFFLDSDDRIAAPDTLEKLCGAAKRHGTDIAGGSLLREKGGAVSGDFTGTRKNYTFTGEGVMSYRDYQYDLGFFRFIYKRDLFEDRTCLFPSYRVFEDPVFMVRIFTRAGRFAHIPDPVYIYRDTEKSLSGSLSSDRLLDMLSALHRSHIPVVVTGLPEDVSDPKLRRALLRTGVVSAGDMTRETALVKLMWTLARTNSVNGVRMYFSLSFGGELTQSQESL
jgi:glycosyltransferase involved in cell wall biosynthesis